MRSMDFADQIDLGLAQIYPVWDEDTSEERIAVSASLVDSYLAILRDDSTLLLLQADDSGDLDEVLLDEGLAGLGSKWLSCCLYCDKDGVFEAARPALDGPSKGEIFLFLLSLDCRLYVSGRVPSKEYSILFFRGVIKRYLCGHGAYRRFRSTDFPTRR